MKDRLLRSIAPYAEQYKRWPQNGRHILAQFDDATIIVYQAYRTELAQFEVREGLLLSASSSILGCSCDQAELPLDDVSQVNGGNPKGRKSFWPSG